MFGMNRFGAKKSRKEKNVCIEVMDEDIWKDFPEDLMDIVIARLPIVTISRFRSVCQKWNSLPITPSFQQLWANSTQGKQPLFFAVYGHGDVEIGALYDPMVKKWHPNNQLSRRTLFRPTESGGLVCYSDPSNAYFRVGNCLTQAWKEFPWSPWPESYSSQRTDVVVGMVTLNQDYTQISTRVYKIVWADRFGNFRVYDSLTNSTSTGKIPAKIRLPYAIASRTVSINTVVYFLCRKPNGIISYDVVSGAWKQVLIPRPPNTYYPSLAECDGRILLVDKEVNDSIGDVVPFSICVWELEMEIRRWREVDRMPSSWCFEFYCDRFMFSCLGNRTLLVMLLYTEHVSQILTYDVVNRVWSKAPRFSLPGRYPKIINGIGFFPCLSASP